MKNLIIRAKIKNTKLKIKLPNSGKIKYLQENKKTNKKIAKYIELAYQVPPKLRQKIKNLKNLVKNIVFYFYDQKHNLPANIFRENFGTEL